MKNWIVMLMGAGLALQTGCSKTGSRDANTESSDVLARYHFVGSGQLVNNTNAAKLKEIWSLPETGRLMEQTLQKLSHGPRTFFGESIDATQDGRGAVLLRPLLDDLLRNESFFQLRGTADHPTEWTLLVHLPAERAKAWGTAIGELLQVWKMGPIKTNSVEGVTCLEVNRADDPGLVRWAEAREWSVLGIGQDRMPAFEGALGRLRSSGRPVAAATNYWLEAELDLPKLSRLLNFSPSFGWPSVQLSIIGRGENLRSTGGLTFAQPSTGPLAAWQVPTHLINDPLISFTAAHGVERLLRDVKMFGDLGIEPTPNELFVWAQSAVPFQTFWAWPSSDTTNTLRRIAERAPTLLSPEWQKGGLAHIVRQPTNGFVYWKDLPLITPMMRPRTDGGREYLRGGLFPPVTSTNPLPAELLSQVTGRSNLVYYDWEITQGRLEQWTDIVQFALVLANRPYLNTNQPARPWITAVGPHLGNTITEVVAETPAQWSMTRKSHLGLTGIEIVALSYWLESTNFPRLNFDLPKYSQVPARKSAKPTKAAPK